MYPETVLNRLLFTTRYTRYLNKHGYLRFHHWKLYGNVDSPPTILVIFHPVYIDTYIYCGSNGGL